MPRNPKISKNGKAEPRLRVAEPGLRGSGTGVRFWVRCSHSFSRITGPGARVGERLSFARVVHCSFNRSTIAHHWLRVSEAVPLPDTRFYEMHANLATAVGVAVSVLSTEMLKLPSAGLANDHYMRVVSILMRSTSCEFYGGYLYSRRKIMLPTNQGIRRLRV